MLSEPDVETPLAERVAETQRRLASCFDLHSTMVALSGADLKTLRALEPAYTFRPWPAAVLREKIAEAHLQMVRGKVLMSTRNVTADVVRDWALGTLEQWLGGPTDFDPRLGGQFRIRLLDPTEVPAGTAVVQVSTINDYDPRRFLVTIEVTEAP